MICSGLSSLYTCFPDMQVSDRGQQKKTLEFEEVLDASTMSEVVRNCTALVFATVRNVAVASYLGL